MRLPALGLRGRLAISIAVIIVTAFVVTYVAVYRGTGSDLRQQTDDDLAREADSLAAGLSGPPPVGPAGYVSRARQLVAAQGLGPSASLIAISVAGAGTVTNQPELLGTAATAEVPGMPMPLEGGDGPDGSGPDDGGPDRREPEGDEDHGGRDRWEPGDDDFGSAREVLRSGAGYSNLDVEEAGEVRLLTRVVALPEGVSATIRVGQPLASVERALEGLSRTFLVVGLLALLAAIAAGWLLASRTAQPIRRLVGVTEGVGGGDLSARMDLSATRNDEVRRLAESLNLMLDRLEAAFTSQRAFVADASHDLRTPLTIVRGQLEVLARNPAPAVDDVRRVTAQVRAATDRMERLVEDLLMLARSDSAATMKLEKSDVGPLLAAEVETFREAGHEGVRLGDVARVSVWIDRERLARAVSNLLANAVSHAGAGGQVRVSAELKEGDVAIHVDDDGNGVPTGERERIFDRFARLDSSRSSDGGGSGLGLAIVRAIAEAHCGRATCSESPLGGARFTIRLPVDPAA
jgi:signal transduction histidine kinase